VSHPSIPAAAALAALALAAAGCGSSGSSTTNAASSGASSNAAHSTGPYGEATSGGAASTSTSATSTAAASSCGVVLSTKRGKLGTILAAGGKHLTVYMFEGDRGATSACTGACAQVWPPVTTSGAPSAGGGAVASDLGTITRPDGTMQVTYKGHPLYYFARDGDAGDAYGQGVVGFGAAWYVLAPSGKKVDNS
jgi:predicted lipoprotein with Yx(FWY)xxD motif